MRVASGPISLRISSRLPATSGIMLLKPVTFRWAVQGLRMRLRDGGTRSSVPLFSASAGFELFFGIQRQFDHALEQLIGR
jgi:hypothetical protein